MSHESPFFSVSDLRVLTSLREGKTLRRVAVELHVQAPRISRCLRAIEDRAGFALTERWGRRLRLNAAGFEIANGAAQVVAELDGLEHLLREMRASRGGPLRIIATRGPGDYVLPSILASFSTCYPNVDIDFRIAAPQDIWRMLLDDGYDLGIGPEAGIPFGLSGQQLYADRLLLFVPSTSDLAADRSYTWQDLADRKLLVAPFEGGWRRVSEELTRRGTVLPKQTRLGAIEAVKKMVQAGAGIGVLLETAIWQELRDRDFVEVVVRDFYAEVPVRLVRRPSREPQPIIETFCSFVVGELSKLHRLAGLV